MVVVLVRHPTSLEMKIQKFETEQKKKKKITWEQMIIHTLFFSLFLCCKTQNRPTDLLQWIHQTSRHLLALSSLLMSLSLNTFIKVAAVKPLQLAVDGALPYSGQFMMHRPRRSNKSRSRCSHHVQSAPVD